MGENLPQTPEEERRKNTERKIKGGCASGGKDSLNTREGKRKNLYAILIKKRNYETAPHSSQEKVLAGKVAGCVMRGGFFHCDPKTKKVPLLQVFASCKNDLGVRGERPAQVVEPEQEVSSCTLFQKTEGPFVSVLAVPAEHDGDIGELDGEFRQDIGDIAGG